MQETKREERGTYEGYGQDILYEFAEVHSEQTKQRRYKDDDETKEEENVQGDGTMKFAEL